MAVQKSIKDFVERKMTSLGKATKASTEKGRIRRPICITGIQSRSYRVIPANELHLLKIDESYQRMRVDGLSGDLQWVLEHGGQVPHPATLIRRKDGDMYVVDGQQRFWGHLGAEVAMPAMIYEVDSYETERQMFIALNTTSRVAPGLMVKSWPGPCAGLLLDANDDKEHPLHQRVAFTPGVFQGNKNGTPAALQGRIGAVAIVKGMRAVSRGKTESGGIVNIMQELDQWIVPPAAGARARLFLNLIADVFPKGKADAVKLIGVGLVAFKRWGETPDLPPDKVVSALASVEWDRLIPHSRLRFMPVISQELERRWPENWRRMRSS